VQSSNHRKDCRSGEECDNKVDTSCLGRHAFVAGERCPDQAIAASLRDNLNVRFIAPLHCTGEPAFAILKESFGDRYIYAGLGTTVLLGPKVTVKAETGQLSKHAMDAEDLRSYREAMTRGSISDTNSPLRSGSAMNLDPGRRRGVAKQILCDIKKWLN